MIKKERAIRMSRNTMKIEKLTRKIEQKKALLSDLSQKAKPEERKDDTRRKIIYGCACLALLNSLSIEKADRTRAAVEKMITNKRDREFLGPNPISDDKNGE